MHPQQEAVALFKHLESRGFRPSVRSIGIALRALRLSFDDKQLRAWLKPFTAVPPHESRTITASSPRSAREKEVSLVSEAPSLFVNSQGPERPKKPRKPKVVDTTWLPKLEAGVDFSTHAKLAELKPSQLVVFARLFAAWYGHYCADEQANYRRGVALSPKFARIATIPRFASLTCRQYTDLCERFLELNGGRPFHDPYAIQAVMEVA